MHKTAGIRDGCVHVGPAVPSSLADLKRNLPIKCTCMLCAAGGGCCRLLLHQQFVCSARCLYLALVDTAIDLKASNLNRNCRQTARVVSLTASAEAVCGCRRRSVYSETSPRVLVR
eukprot:366132-Chlamydomonas_euryale.AAC.8